MDWLFDSLAVTAGLFFAWKRLCRYLHIYQQDDYDGKRFLRWIISARVFDRRASLFLLLIGFCASWVSASLYPPIENLFAAVILLVFALMEEDPRQVAKKRLVITQRAKRILVVALLCALLVIVPVVGLNNLLSYVVWIQILPLLLVFADMCLVPVEKSIQNSFKREAEKQLAAIAPKIIGITGSFGKTSVKHILGHLLEMNAPTLYTPGSINTLMGIVRVIRERLQVNCRFFLVEMGAYGRGSIERLCALTPPDFGIITAIGAAHYERFQSLDAVAHAKFELAEAVIKKGSGFVVIDEKAAYQPYAAEFVKANRSRFIITGRDDGVDLRLLTVAQEADGLHLSVSYKDKSYVLFAPLFGLHHAENVAVAFVAALALGLPEDRVINALRSVPQIQHRLQVKPDPSGVTTIDDAYNSNPIGFVSALHLLDMLGKNSGGKRILVTPGVTELGAQHDEVHRSLGEEAALCTDYVILVCPERLKSFSTAYCDNRGRNLLEVSNLTQARQWLLQNTKNKDVVLFENDLPDLYEKTLIL